jgi:hypothetical protein
MIIEADLTRLRQAAQALLRDEASIVRITSAPDGAGGTLESETILGTFPALFSASITKPSLRPLAERLGIDVLRQVTLPHDAPAQMHDIVVIAGRRYKVVHVETHTLQILKVCVVQEVV